MCCIHKVHVLLNDNVDSKLPVCAPEAFTHLRSPIRWAVQIVFSFMCLIPSGISSLHLITMVPVLSVYIIIQCW